MRITKHEHACFVAEEGDDRLVVDPGGFTSEALATGRVVAIVVTHEHADHWNPEQLRRLLAKNPDARLFVPAGVAAAGSDFAFTVVGDGDAHEAGVFRLSFHGSRHAVIHPSIPVIDNVGVMVNERLFYPGDAFTIPPRQVDVLAVPAGAPWLKISEVMDYVDAVKPRRAFATHDMGLSEWGRELSNARIENVTTQSGGTFMPLAPGETITL